MAPSRRARMANKIQTHRKTTLHKGVRMSFSTKRGRPAQPKLARDNGTPELQSKKSLGLTSEAIDICLERRLITREQHWAGLHYRWLYTVRYGAPSLSSHWWRLSGESSGPRTDNISWRTSREQEYTLARDALMHKKLYECVMQIAVYNETPCFLRSNLLQLALCKPALLSRIESEQHQFASGLELLAGLWRTITHRQSE